MDNLPYHLGCGMLDIDGYLQPGIQASKPQLIIPTSYPGCRHNNTIRYEVTAILIFYTSFPGYNTTHSFSRPTVWLPWLQWLLLVQMIRGDKDEDGVGGG